jgi:hypothetical protein
MPRLIRLDTGKEIGTLDDAQLAVLVEHLEEDHDDDKNYYIDRDTLDLLSDNGVDPDLLGMLEKGMGDDEQMTISWE